MMHYFHGKHKVEGWTDVRLVAEANHFARHILLRGAMDGSSLESPVGGQLSVTPGLVSHLGLQGALQAGLLLVEF
jgi:hypothetical protein